MHLELFARNVPHPCFSVSSVNYVLTLSFEHVLKQTLFYGTLLSLFLKNIFHNILIQFKKKKKTEQKHFADSMQPLQCCCVSYQRMALKQKCLHTENITFIQ